MPKQKIHFLASPNSVPLTKSYSRDINGDIRKSNYPIITNLNSFVEEVETIEEFYSALTEHAQQGHCLIKGQLDRILASESRKGHANSKLDTQYMVLDIDGLDINPDDLMRLLGLSDVDYILQYSASAGIISDKDRYHIFFLLQQPAQPGELKLLLKYWNLSIPVIQQHIELASSGFALKWPLDITVCQNDKLLYITPPVCGHGVTDNLDCERISLVKKGSTHATITNSKYSSHTISDMESALKNELREKKGLPARSYKTSKYKGIEVLSDADHVEISSVEDCGDFVRLNINGGDSNAYWHSKSDPSIIRNFKGEPNLITEQVAPEYYRQALSIKEDHTLMYKNQKAHEYINRQQKAFNQAMAAKEKIYFTFRDRSTDQYYVGYYDYGNDIHDFRVVSSKVKAQEYLIQHHVEKPPIIETWEYRFEPAANVVIDPERRFINQYIPSEYIKNISAGTTTVIPKSINRVIHHALGNDQIMVEHYLNWLAVVVRYRITTQTAWVLQGTTGTGKGLLFHHIISPLIGREFCTMVTLPNMEDKFNKHLEHTIVLFVDEVDTDQIQHTDKLIAKLKNMITEPSLTIRGIRSDIREVNNHVNIIMASNRPNSMRIEENDRRFNICPRQETKLLVSNKEGQELILAIQDELQEFANYLYSREADKSLATSTINNDSKRLLQMITQTAIEEVVEALKSGDLNYFMENVIGDSFTPYVMFDNEDIQLGDSYKHILREALATCSSSYNHVLTHKDLFVLCEGLVGNIARSKTKLGKFLGHNGIHIRSTTSKRKSIRGFPVRWNATDIELRRWKKMLKETSKQHVINHVRS